jgi:hypothetical protein
MISRYILHIHPNCMIYLRVHTHSHPHYRGDLHIHTVKIILVLELIAVYIYISFGATAPIWALAYLHKTLRFISVYQILDIR